MQDLKGSQRKYLRSLAHGLQPVCYVGKNGVTEALLDSVRTALADHELIKMKFIDGKEVRKQLADQIAQETDSNVIGLIGNIAILYREQDDPEKRAIVLP